MKPLESRIRIVGGVVLMAPQPHARFVPGSLQPPRDVWTDTSAQIEAELIWPPQTSQLRPIRSGSQDVELELQTSSAKATVVVRWDGRGEGATATWRDVQLIANATLRRDVSEADDLRVLRGFVRVAIGGPAEVSKRGYRDVAHRLWPTFDEKDLKWLVFTPGGIYGQGSLPIDLGGSAADVVLRLPTSKDTDVLSRAATLWRKFPEVFERGERRLQWESVQWERSPAPRGSQVTARLANERHWVWTEETFGLPNEQLRRPLEFIETIVERMKRFPLVDSASYTPERPAEFSVFSWERGYLWIRENYEHSPEGYEFIGTAPGLRVTIGNETSGQSVFEPEHLLATWEAAPTGYWQTRLNLETRLPLEESEFNDSKPDPTPTYFYFEHDTRIVERGEGTLTVEHTAELCELDVPSAVISGDGEDGLNSANRRWLRVDCGWLALDAPVKPIQLKPLPAGPIIGAVDLWALLSAVDGNTPVPAGRLLVSTRQDTRVSLSIDDAFEHLERNGRRIFAPNATRHYGWRIVADAAALDDARRHFAGGNHELSLRIADAVTLLTTGSFWYEERADVEDPTVRARRTPPSLTAVATGNPQVTGGDTRKAELPPNAPPPADVDRQLRRVLRDARFVSSKDVREQPGPEAPTYQLRIGGSNSARLEVDTRRLRPVVWKSLAGYALFSILPHAPSPIASVSLDLTRGLLPFVPDASGRQGSIALDFRPRSLPSLDPEPDPSIDTNGVVVSSAGLDWVLAAGELVSELFLPHIPGLVLRLEEHKAEWVLRHSVPILDPRFAEVDADGRSSLEEKGRSVSVPLELVRPERDHMVSWQVASVPQLSHGFIPRTPGRPEAGLAISRFQAALRGVDPFIRFYLEGVGDLSFSRRDNVAGLATDQSVFVAVDISEPDSWTIRLTTNADELAPSLGPEQRDALARTHRVRDDGHPLAVRFSEGQWLLHTSTGIRLDPSRIERLAVSAVADDGTVEQVSLFTESRPFTLHEDRLRICFSGAIEPLAGRRSAADDPRGAGIESQQVRWSLLPDVDESSDFRAEPATLGGFYLLPVRLLEVNESKVKAKVRLQPFAPGDSRELGVTGLLTLTVEPSRLGWVGALSSAKGEVVTWRFRGADDDRALETLSFKAAPQDGELRLLPIDASVRVYGTQIVLPGGADDRLNLNRSDGGTLDLTMTGTKSVGDQTFTHALEAKISAADGSAEIKGLQLSWIYEAHVGGEEYVWTLIVDPFDGNILRLGRKDDGKLLFACPVEIQAGGPGLWLGRVAMRQGDVSDGRENQLAPGVRKIAGILAVALELPEETCTVPRARVDLDLVLSWHPIQPTTLFSESSILDVRIGSDRTRPLILEASGSLAAENALRFVAEETEEEVHHELLVFLDRAEIPLSAILFSEGPATPVSVAGIVHHAFEKSGMRFVSWDGPQQILLARRDWMGTNRPGSVDPDPTRAHELTADAGAVFWLDSESVTSPAEALTGEVAMRGPTVALIAIARDLLRLQAALLVRVPCLLMSGVAAGDPIRLGRDENIPRRIHVGRADRLDPTETFDQSGDSEGSRAREPSFVLRQPIARQFASATLERSLQPGPGPVSGAASGWMSPAFGSVDAPQWRPNESIPDLAFALSFTDAQHYAAAAAAGGVPHSESGGFDEPTVLDIPVRVRSGERAETTATYEVVVYDRSSGELRALARKAEWAHREPEIEPLVRKWALEVMRSYRWRDAAFIVSATEPDSILFTPVSVRSRLEEFGATDPGRQAFPPRPTALIPGGRAVPGHTVALRAAAALSVVPVAAWPVAPADGLGEDKSWPAVRFRLSPRDEVAGSLDLCPASTKGWHEQTPDLPVISKKDSTRFSAVDSRYPAPDDSTQRYPIPPIFVGGNETGEQPEATVRPPLFDVVAWQARPGALANTEWLGGSVRQQQRAAEGTTSSEVAVGQPLGIALRRPRGRPSGSDPISFEVSSAVKLLDGALDYHVVRLRQVIGETEPPAPAGHYFVTADNATVRSSHKLSPPVLVIPKKMKEGRWVLASRHDFTIAAREGAEFGDGQSLRTYLLLVEDVSSLPDIENGTPVGGAVALSGPVPALGRTDDWDDLGPFEKPAGNVSHVWTWTDPLVGSRLSGTVNDLPWLHEKGGALVLAQYEPGGNGRWIPKGTDKVQQIVVRLIESNAILQPNGISVAVCTYEGTATTIRASGYAVLPESSFSRISAAPSQRHAPSRQLEWQRTAEVWTVEPPDPSRKFDVIAYGPAGELIPSKG